MRKVLVFTFFLFLIFTSEAFSRPVKLKLSFLENENQKTQVELKASRPVRYHWFYVENPPSMVIDFFEDELEGDFDREIALDSGPIEKIETFYFEEEKIDFLVLSFRHLPHISATSDKQDLTVKVNDILLAKLPQPSAKETQIESALALARERLSAGEAREEPVNIIQRQPEPEATQEKKEILSPQAIVLEEETGRAPLVKAAPFALESDGNLVPDVRRRITPLNPPNEINELKNYTLALLGIYQGEDQKREAQNLLSSDLSQEKVFRSTASSLSLKSYLPTTGQVYPGFSAVISYLFITFSLISIVAYSYKAQARRQQDVFYLGENPKRAPLEEHKPEEKAIEERRRFPRLEIDELLVNTRPGFKIETLDNITPHHECRLRNISMGGVSFELGPRVHAPLIIQMEISLPNKSPIDVCGKIVWHQSSSKKKKIYGACFITVNQYGIDNLNSYVSQNLKNNGK